MDPGLKKVTSLRPGLLLLDRTGKDSPWFNIRNPKRKASSVRFKPYEWPILLDPMAGDARSARKTIWLDGGIGDSRQVVSAKYAMYFLADAKSILDQYCVAKPLFECGDPDLKKYLEQGLRELFQRLREEVQKVCKKKWLQVDRIALAVPSQWTSDFQDVYYGLISDIFEVAHIEFVREVEAIAHYMFRDESTDFWDVQRPSARELVLFLDFGGHSMNSCLYVVVHNPTTGEMPCVYIDTESEVPLGDTWTGSGGCSEQWEFYMIEACKNLAKRLRGRRNRDLSMQNLHRIAETINSNKRNVIGPTFQTPLDFILKEDGESLEFTLTPETIMECFEKAFRGPLRIAETEIKRLKASLDGMSGGTVVISGGSSNHEGLQELLKDMCRNVGLDEPIFVAEQDEAAANVFKGAGYAVGRTTTVHEFMDQGAAFALQRTGKGGFTKFLISQAHRHARIDFTATGSDEWRIICDPFHHAREEDAGSKQPRSGNLVAGTTTAARTRGESSLRTNPQESVQPHGSKRISFRNTYDILLLGEPSRGDWTIDLTLYDPQDQGHHASLHAEKGVTKCPSSASEMCLAIKLWHKGYKKHGEERSEKVLKESISTEEQLAEKEIPSSGG
ncbi:hypothetical protein Micbo1qcDRAFT_196172 [Microdochium bolleyi]|uniref:Actin-like ATPase domain-containing protein n=1 Tax=Microdochium bolleyi TaxID=196109 RepID=A0A136J0F9_9PEZI|nr:hypothetical protein Micbo1qcDRAFT_196172 [Microdochium bolleyi]